MEVMRTSYLNQFAYYLSRLLREHVPEAWLVRSSCLVKLSEEGPSDRGPRKASYRHQVLDSPTCEPDI